jgi:hypothetical protein
MAGESFNPNPTVYTPVKPAGRKSDLSAQSLWINDTPQAEDGVDEVEAIDQDEVFGGTSLSGHQGHCTLIWIGA